MPFKKKDDHAGSGLDKPQPKSLLSRIAGKLKAGSRTKGISKPSGS